MTTPTTAEIRADIEARIKKLSFAVASAQKAARTYERLGQIKPRRSALNVAKRFSGRIMNLRRMLGE